MMNIYNIQKKFKVKKDVKNSKKKDNNKTIILSTVLFCSIYLFFTSKKMELEKHPDQGEQLEKDIL